MRRTNVYLYGLDERSTEIHHVIPIKYGGTNAFQNLFPLPVKIHRNEVNTWWKNY
ncbi:HNH endonuclease signature motif containing protein [Peribacillus sp. TH14]|uniref:HNH endonuclease signature motif containing protein n=1 Tax=Peribacillus sp. TH14 TaxID=2798481 RepID=UPI0031452757